MMSEKPIHNFILQDPVELPQWPFPIRFIAEGRSYVLSAFEEVNSLCAIILCFFYFFSKTEIFCGF